MTKGINRRDFFKVAAVSGAAAAVASCAGDPVEEIIPMLVPPSEYVPGVTFSFATTCQECSANCGMVLRTREGRAIKAEGNPHHPINEGSICSVGQASMQGMYSPSRSKGPNQKGKPVVWDAGINELAAKVKGGKTLYIGQQRSGSFGKLLKSALGANSEILTFDMSPVGSIRKGNEVAFGINEVPHYAIEDAKFLISFGADFMESWLNSQLHMRAYSKMHAFSHGEKGKFVHVSPHLGVTGSNADQWVAVKPGQETQIALAIANQLLSGSALSSNAGLKTYLDGFSVETVAKTTGISAETLKELAKEFSRGGESLAIAGGNVTANGEGTKLQVAVNILNAVAGNVGKTVQFGANYQVGGSSIADMQAAIGKIANGAYSAVIIENVNPAYALPTGSGFIEALGKAPFVVSLSTEEDETSNLAHLHLPTSHAVESWGDANPRAGVFSIQQPGMAKLPGYDTQELGDLLLALAKQQGSNESAASYQDYIKASWAGYQKEWSVSGDFESFWKESLQKGGHFADFKATGATLQAAAFDSAMAPSLNAPTLSVLAVNTSFHDANGAGGNKSWLLEIPDPVTQLVWDSWVELNPDTAVSLGINHGDLVELKTAQGSQKLAAFVTYGVADGVVAVPNGMGREVPFPTYVSTRNKSIFLPHVEMAADVTIQPLRVGERAADLLEFKLDADSGELVYVAEVKSLKATGEEAYMVSPSGIDQHHDIAGLTGEYTKAKMGDRGGKGRGFVQKTSVAVMSGHGHDEHEHELRERHYTTDNPSNTDFYQERAADVAYHTEWSGRDKPVYYENNKWEMSVDLDRCTGCSACVVACYAENNVPVVGKERTLNGREMAWIRISRYQEKNEETGGLETYFTPEMCGQCANAGCEPVCPVYATYHNDEGINAMIYNRCVGTRYCLNNCAYKQRRFNWRTYEFPAPLQMQLNPAVTVREKGVMEKCNFCYQRIRDGKDIAKDQGREIFDGEIQTACQQTCPTDAISFGNIKDPKAKVTQIKSTTKRGYTQLEEVNYKPAITYLKKINHDNRKA